MNHAEKRMRRALMAADVAAGTPLKDVSEKYGLSFETIRNACRENGVALNLKSGAMRVNTYSIIARLCSTDDSLRVIAKDYGVTPQRVGKVYNDCLDVGVPVKRRGRGR